MARKRGGDLTSPFGRRPLRPRPVTFGAVTTAADGADTYKHAPPDQRAWLVSKYRARVSAVKRAVGETRASIRTLPTADAKKAAAARLKELEAESSALAKNDPPYLPELDDDEFEIGRVGSLVSDPHGPSCCEVTMVSRSSGELIVRKADRREENPEDRDRGAPFYLVGVDLEGAAFRKPLAFRGAFRVDGKKVYGVLSVFALRRVDEADPFGQTPAGAGQPPK